MRPRATPQSQGTYQLPPDKYHAAIELNRQLDVIHFLLVGWTLLALGLMLRFRVGARLRRLGAASVPLMIGFVLFARLPFSMYRHWLGLRYGVSIQPWLPWFGDWALSAAITGGTLSLLLLASFRMARWDRRRWWLSIWGVATLGLIAGTYLVPLVFDPLFQRFTPLSRTHPSLIPYIQAVYPIPADRIFEMDASGKTPTLNAYLTGFGSSKRIVLWDTTIARLTPQQIQSVFAHEVGHYVLEHVPRSLALGAAGLFVVLWLFRRTVFEAYEDTPRILAILVLGAFVGEPVVNTYSRWQEHQADLFELRTMSRLTANAGVISAEVDQIMAEIALDDPDPPAFIRFWLYDHPATADRIRFALAWPSPRAR